MRCLGLKQALVLHTGFAGQADKVPVLILHAYVWESWSYVREETMEDSLPSERACVCGVLLRKSVGESHVPRGTVKPGFALDQSGPCGGGV